MRFSARTVVALATVAALGIAACGSDDDGGGGGSSAPASSASDSSSPGSTPDTATPGTTSGEEPKSGGTFTYLHFPAGPSSWDPALATSGATNYTGTANYLSAVYGYLLWNDWTNGKVVPGLAESFESEDATTWVLKLREGVEFSDGTPFDAEAVKFNWERIGAEPKSPQKGIVATIASMNVVDPTTLEVVLKAPNAVFDFTVADNIPFIGSPTALQADPAAFLDRPVGAGPFVLESYNAGDQTAVLKRNPGYWDAPRPYVDELVIRNILDQAQRYSTFVSGAADLTQGLQGPELQQAIDEGHDPLILFAPGGGTNFVFNTTKAPFDDVLARKALLTAWDCGEVNDRVYLGQAIGPMTHMFDEGSPFHRESAPFAKVDHAEAQKLFDEYAAKTGGPMKFTYLIAPHPITTGTADVLAAQLAEYDNVEVEIITVAATDYTANLVQAAFDIARFNGEAADPTSMFADFYTTTGSRNFGKYSNPEVDRLMEQALGEVDQEKRAELLGEVQDIVIAQDYVGNACNRPPNGILKSDRARGLETYGNYGLWMWDQVWIDE